MPKSQPKNSQCYLVTPEGLTKLKEEYHRLTVKERPETLAEVAELRSMGDLSENTAYHQARKKQSFIDGRIKELEEIIQNAVVQQKTNGDSIQMGSHVTVEIEGERQKLTLVGESEADFLSGKVSIASPLGKVLIGKRKGEQVVVEAPGGKMEYRVVEVS